MLMLSLHSLAQQPIAWHFTDLDGLPSQEVYNVMQDKRGYIWIATEQGLCRYDGYRFKTYDNAEINSPAVNRIEEDYQGRIWTKNFNGQVLYVERDSLKLFQQWNKYQTRTFPDFDIYANKMLIIDNLTTAYRVDLKDFSFKKLKGRAFEDELQQPYITSDGIEWMITKHKVIKIVNGNEYNIGNENEINDGDQFIIEQEYNRNILIFHNNTRKITKWSPKQNKFVDFADLH
ncbi:MAG: two-component regulator propeller domain-containing protein, partial [Bacteroidota bacterium]|nr:two-component regulator propeller domain-containing protein [Bacteroidota bacterium]